MKEPTPMHSTAQSSGLPGESQDEGLRHFRDGAREQLQGCGHRNHTKLRHKRPHTFSSRLIVLSVRMVLSSGYSRDFLNGLNTCTQSCTQACKAHLIDLLTFGTELRGIIDAPWRSHCELIHREQRA